MAIIAALWARIWPYLALAGGLLAGLFVVRQSGKAAGRADLEQEMNKRAADARKEARNVADTIDTMGDDPVADKLKSDWVRRNRAGG